MTTGFFKNSLTSICLLALFAQMTLIVYLHRAYFLEKYDVTYWKDRVEHSQWTLPLSKRIIGDDGLFSYVGYELIHGAVPAGLNTETPPVGKYLIGFSIKLFGSPANYALITGLLTLVLFYFIAKRYFKDHRMPLFLTTIIFLDPLFFSQLWKAWVDISQLFFLLANIFFLHYVFNRKGIIRIFFLAASGLSLGLFFETKPAVLFPVIFLLEAVYLFRAKGKILIRLRRRPRVILGPWMNAFSFCFGGFRSAEERRRYHVTRSGAWSFIFFLSTVAGILLPYSVYFSHGYSLIDFVKLQKYIIAFYIQSQLDVHIGAIWQTMLIGLFPDIASGEAIKIHEWSPLWALVLVAGVIGASFSMLKKDIPLLIKGFSIFLLCGLFIYSIIPSYPRYLLVLLPFLYFFAVYLSEKAVKIRLRFIRLRRRPRDILGPWMNAFSFCFGGFRSAEERRRYHVTRSGAWSFIFLSLILLFSFYNATKYMIPSSDQVLQNFYYNFSHQYFQDVYEENLAKASRPQLSREDFRFLTQKTLQDETVATIEIHEEEKDVPRFGNIGYVKVRVQYKTRDLGSFEEKKTIKLVKEKSQWKIVWDWNLLLNGFSPDNTVETNITIGKRGSIRESLGRILVEDGLGFIILINPEKIDREVEEDMLKFLGDLAYQKPVHIQNAYLENTLPNSYIPVVTTFDSMIYVDDAKKKRLEQYPGLIIKTYQTRIYYNKISPKSIENTFFEECCTRIYSSFNYHGVSGVEKEFDDILSGHSGGKIVMKNRNGEPVRTILEKQAKDGQDVILKE